MRVSAVWLSAQLTRFHHLLGEHVASMQHLDAASMFWYAGYRYIDVYNIATEVAFSQQSAGAMQCTAGRTPSTHRLDAIGTWHC